MTRRALIISNPGEPDAENYCLGVKQDVSGYRSHLIRPQGGLWQSDEILELERPSAAQLDQAVSRLHSVDYSLIIFSGHGFVQGSTTLLELKKHVHYDSTRLLISPKQTLILDCCRVIERPAIKTELIEMAKKEFFLNASDCRRYYDERIRQCPKSQVVLYSCDLDERSGDDSRYGGWFSFNLLSGCEKWVDGNAVTYYTRPQILSIVQAYEIAKQGTSHASRGNQNPQISKPRSGPYFPFCIVA